MAQKVTISPQLTGTYQENLIPLALQPDYIAMDERTRTALLAYCARLSTTLDYYNPQNIKDGTWETLLCADPVILSAVIAEYNTESAYAEFLELSAALQKSEGAQAEAAYQHAFFNCVFQAVFQIDAWVKLAGKNFQPNSVGAYLETAVETKGSNWLALLHGAYHTLDTSGINDLSYRLQDLCPCWHFDPASPAGRAATITQAISYGQQLFILLTEIVKEGHTLFQEATRRTDIPAHTGLLLAFLDLFASSQAAMNTLTQKHLFFYYQEVLQGKAAPAVPDRAVLIFQLAKGVQQFVLPQGTPFTTADKCIYENSADQVLTASRIVDCRTLTLVTDGTYPSDNGVYTGIVQGAETLADQPWPLFGGTHATSKLVMSESTLGMAFSCADLFMAEGSRAVTLVFELTALPDGWSDSTSCSGYWTIALTTDKGWISIVPSSVSFTATPAAMTVQFALTPSQPAVMAYSKVIHGAGFESSWPVCQLLLNQQALPQYPALRGLKVSGLQVKTSVSGISNFLLENDGGKLSPAVPFMPYPTGACESNLYIGGREFFVKPLTGFTILMTWDNLPLPGFQSYYAAYNDYYEAQSGAGTPPVFQNQSFRATAFVLDNEFWVSQNNLNGNPNRYYLFTADQAPASTSATTPADNSEWPYVAKGEKKIVLNLDSSTFPYNPYLADFTSLNSALLQGFFCITLADPVKGFGAGDYGTIVSTVALQNSEISMWNSKWYHIDKKPLKPLPAVPYVPKINGLELSYTSDHTYDLSADNPALQWYHVQPWATAAIALDEGRPTLLPVYDETATLYIGLDTVFPSTTISLYAIIDYHAKTVDSDTATELSAAYLSPGGWKPLTILSDQTQTFQCSGILQFRIPDDMSNSGAGMPAGPYWIKFGTNAVRAISATLLSTQAVEVTRVMQPADARGTLPALSITQPITPLPKVKTLLQPSPSYGGRPAQSDQEFMAAMALRTGFKNRAITPIDIEAIVLSAFPALFKVTAHNNPDRTKPGSVWVTVVPYTAASSVNATVPVAPVDLMLQVLGVLEAIRLPDTEYIISNADFVQMRIACTVTFDASGDDEQLAEQLNTDLQLYLSPWIKNNALSAAAGQKVNASAAHAFIQARPYVRQVKNVQCQLLPGSYWGESGTADDYLIIPADRHDIKWNTRHAQQPAGLPVDGLRIGETFYLTD